jgi:hypothetical protein
MRITTYKLIVGFLAAPQRNNLNCQCQCEVVNNRILLQLYHLQVKINTANLNSPF